MEEVRFLGMTTQKTIIQLDPKKITEINHYLIDGLQSAYQILWDIKSRVYGEACISKKTLESLIPLMDAKNVKKKVIREKPLFHGETNCSVFNTLYDSEIQQVNKPTHENSLIKISSRQFIYKEITNKLLYYVDRNGIERPYLEGRLGSQGVRALLSNEIAKKLLLWQLPNEIYEENRIKEEDVVHVYLEGEWKKVNYKKIKTAKITRRYFFQYPITHLLFWSTETSDYDQHEVISEETAKFLQNHLYINIQDNFEIPGNYVGDFELLSVQKISPVSSDLNKTDIVKIGSYTFWGDISKISLGRFHTGEYYANCFIEYGKCQGKKTVFSGMSQFILFKEYATLHSILPNEKIVPHQDENLILKKVI